MFPGFVHFQQSKVGEIHRDFVSVFNKTIIPLALVGYEMIIANSTLRTSLTTTISYPARTRGIIPGGGGGVIGISNDGDDRRIFLGLKFSMPGFFLSTKIWQVFFWVA